MQGSVWRNVWRSFRERDDEATHDDPRMADIIPEVNIYDVSGEKRRFGEFIKRHKWVHFFLKYKLFLPVLYIVGPFLQRKLDHEVPAMLYNKNLQVFNDSFEKAILEWSKVFIRNLPGNEDEKDPDDFARRYVKLPSAQTLRLLKDVVLTVSLNDTAYREFLNIWMFEIAKGMRDAHPAGFAHVLYTSQNIDDVSYFIVTKAVEDGMLKLGIKDARGDR